MNIFALSSGKGPSGIAIIRISGPGTLDVCKSLTGEKSIKSSEINLCKFIDPKNKKVIDPEAILLWFPKPHSFTGDDLAGSLHISNAVISFLPKSYPNKKIAEWLNQVNLLKLPFKTTK